MNVQELTQVLVSTMHSVEILGAGVIGECNKERIAMEMKNVANTLGRTAQAINPNEEPDKELEKLLVNAKLTFVHMGMALKNRIEGYSDREKEEIYLGLIGMFSSELLNDLIPSQDFQNKERQPIT